MEARRIRGLRRPPASSIRLQRNPKPCPALEVLDPGDPTVRTLANGADIRTDLPRYRVFVRAAVWPRVRHGWTCFSGGRCHGADPPGDAYDSRECVDEPTDILEYWRDDLVAFLFGCSSTFEGALERAGIRPRWREKEGGGSGVFPTSIQTKPAGRLHGPMVVSMRPIPTHQVPLAVQVTSRFPNHHGAPVHIGDPSPIGIKDLSKAEWVQGPEVLPGETPVFWACGVTPQTVALESKPDLMITHYPAHMFISDIPSEQQAIL